MADDKKQYKIAKSVRSASNTRLGEAVQSASNSRLQPTNAGNKTTSQNTTGSKPTKTTKSK